MSGVISSLFGNDSCFVRNGELFVIRYSPAPKYLGMAFLSSLGSGISTVGVSIWCFYNKGGSGSVS